MWDRSTPENKLIYVSGVDLSQIKSRRKVNFTGKILQLLEYVSRRSCHPLDDSDITQVRFCLYCFDSCKLHNLQCGATSWWCVYQRPLHPASPSLTHTRGVIKIQMYIHHFTGGIGAYKFNQLINQLIPNNWREYTNRQMGNQM